MFAGFNTALADSAPPDAPKTGAVVARAGGIMMASLLLSRILGLLRDTVMAAQFGVNIDTDAYRLAVTVPDTIFFLIAGGGLSSAFIPVFSELIHTKREKEAWHVFSVVTTLSAIVVALLIAVAWVFAPQIVMFMAEGKQFRDATGALVPLGAAEIEKMVHMSRIMLPAQFAFMVGSILLATLYARNRFVAPGVAPNIYNVGIILGAMLGPTLGVGIAGMSWGATIGAMIGNLVLPILVMMKLGGSFRPSIDLQNDGVRRFFKLLLPVILGFSLPSVAALITQKFASVYEEGTNTVMTLSNNLMQAPLGIFGQSLALAAFPVLAQFYATKEMDKYRFQISRTLRTVLYLSLPSSAILLAIGPQLTDLVYGYGRAASGDELERVVVALRIFTVGIFAWCVQPVLMRGFFSIHQTLRPVMIGTVMTAVFIALCWGLQGSPLGYQALPWATNVAAILLMFALYVALQKEVGSLDTPGLVMTFGKSLVGSVVMGAVAYGAFLLYTPAQKLPLALMFLAVCAVSGWVYFFVTKALKMPETEYLDRAFKRLDRRKPKSPATG